jgi:8-oxo-dGTP pyrophosphatase MutT (NUDIX family)
MATVFEFSAGGVVVRRNEAGGPEVALIATQGGARWSLPKGLIEANEAAGAAALREVQEETGLTAEIVRELAPIEYWFWWGESGAKVRHHKKVQFFLMEARGGYIGRHDYEVDEVRWFPLDEAIERASYRSERKVLEEARSLLAAG